MRAPETNLDAVALALQALIWTIGEPARAARLLDVTGLDPADLRARAGDPVVLAAALGFLEAYEPDLVACAASLQVKPEAIVAARRALEPE
ncbi:MAG: hypothetical protein JWN66_3251 [Sphingomonas bacterium]|jgi:hypothetical protein|uniref:DUF3572 domain-containing protein n=1 Tax=Sphingomonas bacterium TaxID=1895847 RepID=UPI0026248C8F|nr:DUF3572 domain-containing protein [Sphingomonas bacterium]MDB5706135.1 hypothetical protein [Sphingomonas bacterium]